MTNKNNIEQLFKKTFETYEQVPSGTVWKGIQRKIFLKKFLTYSAFSLNLWNIALLVGIFSVSAYFLRSNIEKKALAQEEKITTTIHIDQKEALNTQKITTAGTDVNKLKKAPKNKTVAKQESISKVSKSTSEEDISENVEEIISDSEKTEKINAKLTHKEKMPTVKLADTPHANFSVSSGEFCEPAEISFSNLSEHYELLHWDFGNGEKSLLKNPTYTFKTAGVYNVTLTVKSGSSSDFLTKQIIIHPKPETSFMINKAKKLFNTENVSFINNASGYSACIWNFGDTNTSTEINPKHIYNEPGIYKVSLICISDNNCSDTAFINNVYIQDYTHKIKFPTAFAPDRTGYSGNWRNSAYPNTIFHPFCKTKLYNYQLQIYNKYGTLVFESHDFETGWNGYFENKPAKTGVYIWKCRGKFENGELFEESGNVTLLHTGN